MSPVEESVPCMSSGGKSNSCMLLEPTLRCVHHSWQLTGCSLLQFIISVCVVGSSLLAVCLYLMVVCSILLSARRLGMLGLFTHFCNSLAWNVWFVHYPWQFQKILKGSQLVQIRHTRWISSTRHVHLFNTYALELHGPTDPYKSMDASKLAIHTLIDLVTDGICAYTDQLQTPIADFQKFQKRTPTHWLLHDDIIDNH